MSTSKVEEIRFFMKVFLLKLAKYTFLLIFIHSFRKNFHPNRFASKASPAFSSGSTSLLCESIHAQTSGLP